MDEFNENNGLNNNADTMPADGGAEANGARPDGADAPETSAAPENGYSAGYPYGANAGDGNRGAYPYGGNENNGYSYRSQTPPPYGYSQSAGNSSGTYPYGSAGRTGNNGDDPSPYPYSGKAFGRREYPDDGPDDFDDGGYEPPRKNKNVFVIGCVIVVLICALVIGVFLAVGKANRSPSSDDGTETEKPSSVVDEVVTEGAPEQENSTVKVTGELTAKDVYKKIAPASVGVIVYENSSASESGEGSGVLIQEDDDGYTYVITCAHVINTAKSAVVQLNDNTEYKAEIVGYDTRTDIGVLKIKASGLTLADIGDSGSVCVGDPVYAIGNPGGTSFAGSFTNGMVSALDRPVSADSGYTMECIQHTAAINPGNSGGALVNSYGQLIGINSSKIVSEDYEGMGFSVPSSVFVKIVNSIITDGYVADRAKLGITYVAASEYSSYGMYVAIKELPTGSLVIYSINDDSDLKNTDVQEGDMIVSVNGHDLDDSAYLAELIENSSVGDELTLGIVRINKDYSSTDFTVTVKLVEDKNGTSAEETTTAFNFDDFYREYFGESDDGGYGEYPFGFDFGE